MTPSQDAPLPPLVSSKRRKWSPEEDNLLLQLVETDGSSLASWSTISAKLGVCGSGVAADNNNSVRSSTACQQRYNFLSRKGSAAPVTHHSYDRQSEHPVVSHLVEPHAPEDHLEPGSFHAGYTNEQRSGAVRVPGMMVGLSQAGDSGTSDLDGGNAYVSTTGDQRGSGSGDLATVDSSEYSHSDRMYLQGIFNYPPQGGDAHGQAVATAPAPSFGVAPEYFQSTDKVVDSSQQARDRKRRWKQEENQALVALVDNFIFNSGNNVAVDWWAISCMLAATCPGEGDSDPRSASACQQHWEQLVYSNQDSSHSSQPSSTGGDCSGQHAYSFNQQILGHNNYLLVGAPDGRSLTGPHGGGDQDPAQVGTQIHGEGLMIESAGNFGGQLLLQEQTQEQTQEQAYYDHFQALHQQQMQQMRSIQPHGYDSSALQGFNNELRSSHSESVGAPESGSASQSGVMSESRGQGKPIKGRAARKATNSTALKLRWLKADDEKLMVSVAKHGNSGHMAWSAVAASLPPRTAIACQQRHMRLLINENGNVQVNNKKRWSEAEDLELSELVQTFGIGSSSWTTISGHMSGQKRTPASCHERWYVLCRRKNIMRKEPDSVCGLPGAARSAADVPVGDLLSSALAPPAVSSVGIGVSSSRNGSDQSQSLSDSCTLDTGAESTAAESTGDIPSWLHAQIERVRYITDGSNAGSESAALKLTWTEAEDQLLKSLVGHFGVRKWEQVRSHMPSNRSVSACQKRWYSALKFASEYAGSSKSRFDRSAVATRAYLDDSEGRGQFGVDNGALVHEDAVYSNQSVGAGVASLDGASSAYSAGPTESLESASSRFLGNGGECDNPPSIGVSEVPRHSDCDTVHVARTGSYLDLLPDVRYRGWSQQETDCIWKLIDEHGSSQHSWDIIANKLHEEFCVNYASSRAEKYIRRTAMACLQHYYHCMRKRPRHTAAPLAGLSGISLSAPGGQWSSTEVGGQEVQPRVQLLRGQGLVDSMTLETFQSHCGGTSDAIFSMGEHGPRKRSRVELDAVAEDPITDQATPCVDGEHSQTSFEAGNIEGCDSPRLAGTAECTDSSLPRSSTGPNGGSQMAGDESAETKAGSRSYRYWSSAEDLKLRALVSQLGTNSWTAIAADMGGRTVRGCQDRWYLILLPGGRVGAN